MPIDCHVITLAFVTYDFQVLESRSAMAGVSSEIIFDYVSSEDLPSALKIEQEG